MLCSLAFYSEYTYFLIFRLLKDIKSKLWGLYFNCIYALAEPHSSVGSVADLRTGGRWFDPRLGQYSFRRLMIVIATALIPLSPLSVVSTTVTWGGSQWLGKNIVRRSV